MPLGWHSPCTRPRVGELIRRDLRLVLDAVKLSDDPDWLTEPDPEFVEAARGTDTAVAA
jgi:hypothetical protein